MRLLSVLLLAAVALNAEEKVDLYTIHRIKAEAFQNSKVMEHAFYLTDVHGPRLTGSPGIRGAAEWVLGRLREWGLQDPKLEKWGPFGRGWSNVRFTAHLKEPQYSPLIGFARPWSPSTNGPVSGDPILAILRTEADFDKFKDKLKGKIVLIEPPRALTPITSAPNRRFSESELDAVAQAPDPAQRFPFVMPIPNQPAFGTPQGPGGPPPGPVGPVFAAPSPGPSGQPFDREGQRRFRSKLNQFLTQEGVLVAVSPGDRTDGGTVRATAAGSREEKDPLPPPSVALTPEHYNRLARLIERKIPVTLEFDIQNRFHEEDKDSFNVIAEIPGDRKKDELVMLGAHFDSWTGGTGATDNAAGSVVVLEAIRILKALDLKMPRTVRLALWTGEEQGLLGSRAYVKDHFADRETMTLKPEHTKLSGYFNLDNGTGKIRGVYLQGNDMIRPIFEAWLGPFKDLGATTTTIRSTSGTDHLSFDAVGLPGFQFVQDPVEYSSRSHHTNMDLYDRLQAGDLIQASAIMASFVYHTAIREEMLPRRPLPKPEPRGRPGDRPRTGASDN